MTHAVTDGQVNNKTPSLSPPSFGSLFRQPFLVWVSLVPTETRTSMSRHRRWQPSSNGGSPGPHEDQRKWQHRIAQTHDRVSWISEMFDDLPKKQKKNWRKEKKNLFLSMAFLSKRAKLLYSMIWLDITPVYTSWIAESLGIVGSQSVVVFSRVADWMQKGNGHRENPAHNWDFAQGRPRGAKLNEEEFEKWRGAKGGFPWKIIGSSTVFSATYRATGNAGE